MDYFRSPGGSLRIYTDSLIGIEELDTYGCPVLKTISTQIFDPGCLKALREGEPRSA
jgi:hypothetical protein